MLSCYHCKEKALLLDEQTNRLFCTVDHGTRYKEGWACLFKRPIFYERATRHLGMKRANDDDDDELLIDLIEKLLPDDVMGEILSYVFADLENTYDMIGVLKDVFTIRETSLRMRDLVDKYVIGTVRQIVYKDTGLGGIGDDKLYLFTGLKKLDIGSESLITGAGLVSLSGNLEELWLGLPDDVISDSVLRQMTKLHSLVVGDYAGRRNEGISTLTRLRFLQIFDDNETDDECFKYLPNLENLSIGSQNVISGHGFVHLTRLTSLDVDSYAIPDDALISLAGTLRVLSINEYQENYVTNRAMLQMTGLEELMLMNCKFIDDDAFATLTNLKKLSVDSDCTLITDRALSGLKQLAKLYTPENERITMAGVMSCAQTLKVIAINNFNFYPGLELRSLFPRLRKATIGARAWRSMSREEQDTLLVLLDEQGLKFGCR